MSSADDSALLLRNVEVEGEAVDVLVRDGTVAQIGAPDAPDARVVDGRGGALLPGLHDHHLHLLATAAARTSVDCAGLADRDDLAHALRTAEGPWVRAVRYDERLAGPLDRHVLDALVPDRPVRVQHRTGALWVLNSAALAAVRQTLDASPDVERDDQGRPNGRLWRYDARLRPALRHAAPDLRPVAEDLARHGITGVTDATPDLDQPGLDLLATARRTGALPHRVTLLGAPTGGELPAGLDRGAWKLHLRDHDLPSPEALTHAVRTQHADHRAVAVHCVTAESLLLTLAALEDAGALPGDRIEHASVVPPGIAARIAEVGARVVTQPGFLHHRGDAYLREVEPTEQPWLYPYRSLIDAGVLVAPSSDAPHAPTDPWQAIAAATSRRTATGQHVATDEAVSAAQVLDGFLSPADDPGGRPRRVEVSAPADLVLLDVPLARALAEVPRNPVRLTLLSGVPTSEVEPSHLAGGGG